MRKTANNTDKNLVDPIENFLAEELKENNKESEGEGEDDDEHVVSKDILVYQSLSRIIIIISKLLNLTSSTTLQNNSQTEENLSQIVTSTTLTL
jgi:hypothetical protein